MNASRITALGLVGAAALWITSDISCRMTTPRATPPSAPPKARLKLFRVAVIDTSWCRTAASSPFPGRTEADKKVTVTARTGGILTELIKRGSPVKGGDVIAVLSDDSARLRWSRRGRSPSAGPSPRPSSV